MADNITSLYASCRFNELYSDFVKAIDMYGMRKKIMSGVLIGLSGGADSVMLLMLMLQYRKENGDFPIFALHVNHGIRGDEALQDEKFSLDFAKSLGVEACSVKVSCPELKRNLGGSMEEIARNARYAQFNKIISERADINCIAVAHNADDNLETVLFNLMRGTGTAGLSGIPPMRDNIIRPMILIKKADIISVLDEAKIPYVTDSTNLDNTYARNFIRNQIIPLLEEKSQDIHKLTSRLSKNLRMDNDYIDGVAADIFSRNNGEITSNELSALHPAVASRLIKRMAAEQGCIGIEASHINKILELSTENNFSYSIPGNLKFVCEFGRCRIIQDKSSAADFCITLNEDITDIPEFSAKVVLSDRKNVEISSNVYNFSIQADISSVIINNGIYVRKRKEGDAYRFGGMTHKLKKLFCDRKIPRSDRSRIPVFCDGKGIIWVPGFGVRDDCANKASKKYLTLYYKSTDGNGEFYIPKNH